jgi:uncharacterized membrane-anchored protein YhcB (DUF1043 family)
MESVKLAIDINKLHAAAGTSGTMMILMLVVVLVLCFLCFFLLRVNVKSNKQIKDDLDNVKIHLENCEAKNALIAASLVKNEETCNQLNIINKNCQIQLVHAQSSNEALMSALVEILRENKKA